MVYEYLYSEKIKSKTVYVCKNTYGNIEKLLSEQIKIKIRNGDSFDKISIAKDGRICIKKYVNTKHINTRYNGLTVVQGDNLTRLIDRDTGLKPRRMVKTIVNYLKSPHIPGGLNSICVLHGIRRTGKTVALMHSIDALVKSGINVNKVAYILANNTATIDELIHLVSNIDCNYLFIDEVTNIEGFVDKANILSDIESASKKIVLTGTDSFVFPYALSTTLFQRAVVCHSTLISYTESMEINIVDRNRPNRIDDYIAHGGVIVPNEYRRLSEAKKTLESVTFYNIMNSIRKNSSILNGFRSKHTIKLTPNEFIYIVYNIIQMSTEPKNIYTFGTRLLALSKDTKRYLSEFAGAVGIQFNRLNALKSEVLEDIINSLVDLDIIRQVANCAQSNPDYNIESITDIEIITLIQSLLYTVKYHKNNPKNMGTLFENFVISQLIEYEISTGKDIDIKYCKYSCNEIEHEIDCIVTHANSTTGESIKLAIEIKYSDTPKVEFTQHLLDESLNKVVDGITEKLVVYRGKSGILKGIKFVNVEEFLINLDRWLG